METYVCVDYYAGHMVYLPVIKITKLYYITKEYPKLNILGDTRVDREKGIKRWPSDVQIRKMDKNAQKNMENVSIMD